MIVLIILFLIMVMAVISIKHNEKEYVYDNEFACIMFFSSLVVTIVLVGALVIPAHIGTEYKIQNAQLERQAIIKELDLIQSEVEDVSKQKVYEDVREWNKEVLRQKGLANNYFSNIFVNKKVADSMEVIDIYEGE